MAAPDRLFRRRGTLSFVRGGGGLRFDTRRGKNRCRMEPHTAPFIERGPRDSTERHRAWHPTRFLPQLEAHNNNLATAVYAIVVVVMVVMVVVIVVL